ncbi:Heat shock protein Hsp70 [Metarhizium album ARSEF 1941]|uniref:Heat shock protein Hsp70 n=1 Tax=Metarhizium album (strain ARSEF 1941) TaxID=1081103 RepID=A0A0B2X3W3_METAS|nr:Heat shock protein Hsp70 [Metarhizium album ARSEF 1941]KHO00120.1 Heat shock protein Hsp70 [Metarhizium album ARSEF 1941]
MDEYIIVGIDFGTTYSGVAWAYSKEPEEIEVVTTWNSDLNHCSDLEKTPTHLYFGKGRDNIKWGYAVPENDEVLEWFKLLLLKEQDLPSDLRHSPKVLEARRLQEASHRDVVDLVACFLTQLWKHALQSIEEANGKNLVEKCRFYVVMTLPAIWPHYAQESMRQAAQKAGILSKRCAGETVLSFVSEPEAAALATIKDHSKKSTIKDLISYRVERKEPFVLKECVKGEGGLCGGIFLDEQFKKLIISKTSNWLDTVDKRQLKKFLNDNWEHGIKPQFRGQNRSWGVELPNSVVAKRKGKKRTSTLEIMTSELIDVFDPIVAKVKSLVLHQSMAIMGKYGEKQKFIILVGGFGRSPYLFEQLKLLVGEDTTVLQSRGSKPWAAICRGAVAHGITALGLSGCCDVKVDTRVARMSYGVEISEPFNHEIHSYKDWFIDPCTLEQEAANQMQWFIRQGLDLSATTSVRHQFRYTFNGAIGPISEEFVVSSSSKPPSRRDQSVSVLCKVNWEKTIKRRLLPIGVNNRGEAYRILEYEIEMTCNGTTVDFTVYYDGERVAQHVVQVEYV